MKRVLAILLSIVLLLTLMPVWGVGAFAATESDMESMIEAQIRAYADSIDQSNADTSAAADLAVHGIRGNGKTLNMGPSSPLTAALLNSELVQEGFAVIFADVIRAMQRMNMQAVPGVSMDFGWYGAKSDYGAIVLTGSEEYPDNLDWLVSDREYKGTLNAYDQSLEWMVGNCGADVVIKCIEDNGSLKTYKVTATFRDRFDFSTANNSGYKKLFSGLGMLLFKEFDWNCTVTLNITAPYFYDHCSHSSGAYHWVYDGENRAMISDGSGDYLQNNTTHHANTAEDGTVRHYYELDNTIRLYHDKPWVVEYDVRTPTRIVFAPVDNAVTKTYPQIVQSGRTSFYVISKDYAMAENDNGNLDRYYAFNYYGTKLQELFPFAYDKTYTFRLENVIGENGTNMIYLSAFETQTGTCCLDRVPMDDYYYYGGWMDETALISEESSWLSGKDIYINYFGTGSYGFDAKAFDLRIWENGPENPSDSYWSEKQYAATCTEKGCTRHTCTVCGSSYDENVVPALGHSIGEWEVTTNPGCTAAGNERRSCTACDYSENREIAKLGHAYEAVVTQPGCTTEGYTTRTCKRCGNSYTDSKTAATGHNFEDWTTVTPAGCTTEGLEQRICACGHSETRTVPATGHSHAVTVTEPTCTTAGRTVYTCACGHTYEENYIPALGHSGGEPTCSGLGKCAVCGAYYGKRNPDNHAGGTKVENRVEPDDDTEGYSGDVYCSGCGELLEEGKVLPAAHRHAGNLTRIEAIEATHETAGNMEHFICSCGKWFTDAEGAQEIENHESVKVPALSFAYGDVNHDGDIKISDAILVMKYRAGNLSDGDTFCERCANVKGEGPINIQSAILIMKKRANKNMLFPVELQ